MKPWGSQTPGWEPLIYIIRVLLMVMNIKDSCEDSWTTPVPCYEKDAWYKKFKPDMNQVNLFSLLQV